MKKGRDHRRGPAGVSVAETIRAYDRQAELIVVSAEPYPPYSPPAMVDHFLTGSQSHLWRGEIGPSAGGRLPQRSEGHCHRAGRSPAVSG